MWDKVVYGKEVLKKKPEPPKPDPTGKSGKFVPRQFGPAITFELDEHNRPKQKVALLCGPPGMGKTTLAHTIAKHAGYNVVEVTDE
jgi:chromosome transmission fidelity protein 18